MIRIAGTFATLMSAILFPWHLTAFLAIGMSIIEPWVPLAAGLFVDTLYYGGGVPWFAFAGAAVTAFSFLVRSRLKTGSIVR